MKNNVLAKHIFPTNLIALTLTLFMLEIQEENVADKIREIV